MQVQSDKTNEELWRKAIHWVNRSPHVRPYVRKKHYLMYSPYDMSDFVAEAYLVAYEALSCPDNFERVFWTRFKIRCNELANAPHGNYFVDVSTVAIEDDTECVSCLDYDAYISTISKVLNMLTPSQRQLCRVIIFANRPINTEYLARAFQITPSAISQRISAIIRKINEHKTIYGAFYDDREIP